MNTLRCTLALIGLLGAAAASAQTESRSYTLGPFDRVQISGSALVRFTQGPQQQVVVEGDDAVQRSVLLKVDDGSLSISTAGAWKFWASRQVQINITAAQLKAVGISGSGSFSVPQRLQGDELKIAISGAGTVRLDQVQLEALRFGISGSGDGSVAGQTRTLNVAVSGRGKFDGEQLASETAKVAISGVADVGVWALRDLSIAVAGSGSVDYWGSPQVKRSVAGRADIQHRGDKSPAGAKP